MMSNLRAIARQLGGDVAGDHLVIPGPGHSARDRSLAVWIDGDHIRVHSHASDDWRQCRDHVRGLLGIAAETVPTPSAKVGVPKARLSPAHTDAAGISRAMTLWRESISPWNTLVIRYLASRRLTLPDTCEAIRFHPACPYRVNETTFRLPTMLALLRDAITDQPCGIHRTALKPDGSGKADIPDDRSPKRMLGRAKGAAIKIDADDAVMIGLHIAEGIESSLAARQLGYSPVWAVGSAGAIADMPVLVGIEALTIIHDTDEAGRRAAEACAGRWEAAGAEVLIASALGGGDANDALGRLA
jgi:putative DNA primase/helicase